MKLIKPNIDFNNPVKITEKHMNNLGYSVPKNYFSESKKNILKQTILKDKKRQQIKKLSYFAVAATVTLLFTMSGIYSNWFSKPQTSLNDTESEILITSLFMDEENTEQLLDSYMLEDLYDESVSMN